MIDQSILVHIVEQLGEAENLPLRPMMSGTVGEWNGATVVGLGSGLPPFIPGFEGIIRVFSPTNATMHCVNGCPCGCQLTGTWNGHFWTIVHAENGISAN